MSQPLRVGVAGLGTVGGGVVRLLREQADLLALRCGRPIVVVAASARDLKKKRDVDLQGIRLESDPLALASARDVDVVVEVMGGSDGPARALIEAAIANGKSLVTANKALLALHGAQIAKLAEAKGTLLGFEASVAGGIPIIKALREGLVGNRVKRLYGILNGTCNYILTTMRETKRDFADVLAEAQKLGYAEADPSFDIDGVDAAHKLSILAAAAFGAPVNFAGVHVEGIRRVGALDIAFAEELEYRIKLLGVARETEHGVEQRVHPCMVSNKTPIAHVDGVFNAVVVEGDFVGTAMFQGRGAGAGPTASAVVADLVDVARGHGLPPFVVPTGKLSARPVSPIEKRRGAYYMRLMVLDRPGVIADVTAALRDERVSLESMLQHGRSHGPDDSVPVVLVTHETEEVAMRRAVTRIAALDTVIEPPNLIRIEDF
ncbi:MAG: homoserine dehydrogenase [Alphaproteobacteria bacterium]|nr:homoserine dehydrogenase [Alphaproteobacteria bacterium]